MAEIQQKDTVLMQGYYEHFIHNVKYSFIVENVVVQTLFN